jgi:hypothetical protein
MRLANLLFIAAVGIGAPTAWATASKATGLSIQVQPGDWGNAHVEDIQAVLGSVAAVLEPYFPRHSASRVVVSASNTGPQVLARKSADGAHLVLLNVRDRRWDQFAYQFAHELCHIFSNYDQRPIGDAASREHQWFEETLCEMVSLVALKRLAVRWQDSPPRAGWEDYAPAFREYAERLLSAQHRRVPAHQSPSAWFAHHRVVLENNPYQRDKNELLASSLLELLESTPGSMEAIGYLNLEAPSKPGFSGYLAAWYDCCPEQHRPFVRRVMRFFGAA